MSLDFPNEMTHKDELQELAEEEGMREGRQRVFQAGKACVKAGR